ncbi:hypothetical protein AKJ16_DCAP07321 [Drosera capensis]
MGSCSNRQESKGTTYGSWIVAVLVKALQAQISSAAKEANGWHSVRVDEARADLAAANERNIDASLWADIRHKKRTLQDLLQAEVAYFQQQAKQKW